jgi:hypothetical protein
MIHKWHKGSHRSTKLYQYHAQPFHTQAIKSRDDPKPLVIASSTIMIVVYFAKVSTLYPHVVISSLYGRLENLFLPFFTLPLVYGTEITKYYYKGLLQEYVML